MFKNLLLLAAHWPVQWHWPGPANRHCSKSFWVLQRQTEIWKIITGQFDDGWPEATGTYFSRQSNWAEFGHVRFDGWMTTGQGCQRRLRSLMESKGSKGSTSRIIGRSISPDLTIETDQNGGVENSRTTNNWAKRIHGVATIQREIQSTPMPNCPVPVDRLSTGWRYNNNNFFSSTSALTSSDPKR